MHNFSKILVQIQLLLLSLVNVIQLDIDQLPMVCLPLLVKLVQLLLKLVLVLYKTEVVLLRV
ncbi:hypothetical protein B9K06_26685 [Bacillus sp. OG2]|nr:hypothetical protein B9K06_26685 [Bacillus sp. OG2]